MKTKLLLLAICFVHLHAFAQDVDLEVYASGFNKPIDIQNAGDSRLFIAEQDGLIKVINTDGSTRPTPFLDLTAIVGSDGNEQGLLGLAFHPNYSGNGYFFVNYTNNAGNTVVARYTVSTDQNIADSTSEEIIMTITQPYSNHNGGAIVFGPDGYLYIGMGDGGSGGDPDNNAQNTASLLGKILRIDIDNGLPYTIPSDNPFVSNSSIENEIWAIGVRNPWRFSFDSQNGDLWMGDVGQYDYEEINHTAAGVSGLNYGWRCYEGYHTYDTNGCQDIANYTFPVAEYAHSGSGAYRCSITGGYVYRGSIHTGLRGWYFFADYCSDEIGTVNSNYEITYHEPTIGDSFVTFGEDHIYELYVAGLNSGVIYIIKEMSVAVDEFDLSKSITLHPNPANESTQIRSSSVEFQRVEIFNILGKKIKSLFTNNALEHTLDLTQLSQGIYLLKITTLNQGVLVKKLVVE